MMNDALVAAVRAGFLRGWGAEEDWRVRLAEDADRRLAAKTARALEAKPLGRAPLTIADAARFLGVTPTTLRRWDRAGHLRAFRHPVNGYRLYRPKDLLALRRRLAYGAP